MQAEGASQLSWIRDYLLGNARLVVRQSLGLAVKLRAVRASLGSEDRVSSLQRLTGASPDLGLLEEDIFSTYVANESHVAQDREHLCINTAEDDRDSLAEHILRKGIENHHTDRVRVSSAFESQNHDPERWLSFEFDGIEQAFEFRGASEEKLTFEVVDSNPFAAFLSGFDFSYDFTLADCQLRTANFCSFRNVKSEGQDNTDQDTEFNGDQDCRQGRDDKDPCIESGGFDDVLQGCHFRHTESSQDEDSG